MTRGGLALIALLSAACGAPPSTGAHLPFDLLIDGAFPFSQLQGFQVTMLEQGSSYDCSAVVQSCLKFQVHSAIIPLADASGQTHQALLFPVTLTGDGGVRTEDVTARGIPIGEDYLVVIEAGSTAQPPQLLGSSCNVVPQITAGTNPPLVAAPISAYATGPVGCDPLF